MKDERGSAMVELAIIMPLVAFFLLLIVQFASLFSREIDAVATAEAKAAAAIRSWDLAHASSGFTRPCIEMIQPQRFHADAGEIAIGAGAWEKTIPLTQEVSVAGKALCTDR